MIRRNAMPDSLHVLGLLAILALSALLSACASTGDSARELHFDSIVIDGHSDTTPRFEDPSWSFVERHSPADGSMDLPRIR